MSTEIGLSGARLVTEGLAQFIPEPAGSQSVWRRLVQGAVSGVSTVMQDISPEYKDILEQQIQIQQQMQLVTLESNIEKSRHETQMAAIRNIRVG